MPDKKKILVVDDERAIQAVLKAILEKAGYQVLSAVDAFQGPMVARQARPDLIVLDIAMPAGGGFKVYERVKMLTGTTTIPILVYSVVPKAEVEKHIPPAPDVLYLAKPASPEDIVAATRKLLGDA
jgi:CheY-like chemotaxis protein